jgi:putative ATP-binding cassette transporter
MSHCQTGQPMSPANDVFDGTPDHLGPKDLLTRFVKFAFGYWTGPSRKLAWGLSLGFLACLVANTGMALLVNRWTKGFFDALQARDMHAVMVNLGTLALLAFGMAVVAAATLQCRMRLQLGWRMWLMSSLVGRWLQQGAHHEHEVWASVDNPEARVAEDGRLAVELFVDLAGGIINTFLVSASFFVVLWQVGGSIKILGIVVPAYLVWAVILYASLTSLLMWLLARPLVARVEDKAQAEGDFRYALTRARQTLHEPVMAAERRSGGRTLQDWFNRLPTRWLLVIRNQTNIAILTSANNLLAPAVPLVLSAPKFLAGQITLGDLMQAAAAFLQVQTSLNWLADNALSLANWSASARRVAALDFAIQNPAKRSQSSTYELTRATDHHA